MDKESILPYLQQMQEGVKGSIAEGLSAPLTPAEGGPVLGQEDEDGRWSVLLCYRQTTKQGAVDLLNPFGLETLQGVDHLKNIKRSMSELPFSTKSCTLAI